MPMMMLRTLLLQQQLLVTLLLTLLKLLLLRQLKQQQLSIAVCVLPPRCTENVHAHTHAAHCEHDHTMHTFLFAQQRCWNT
jgi:hypothetical protein